MPLINTSVPNLIQGVSQQADATRFAGQCEEQENALSSVADGLKKRPNTRHVGTLLPTAMSADSFVHFIDRDDSEKYCVTQDNNTLRIHNALTGEKCTITEQGSSDFTISNNEVSTTGTYLESSLARKNIKPLTIGDSTFLLNRDKEAALDLTQATPDLSNEALVFVKQGDYQRKYGFRIEGRQREGNGESAELNLDEIGVYYAGGPNNGNVNGVRIDPNANTVFPFIKEAGTGFSVNDVVNIILPSGMYGTVYDGDGNQSMELFELIQYVQPTLRVVSTNSDGGITAASIENAGAYVYYHGDMGWMGADYFGGLNLHNYDILVYSSNNSSTGTSGASATFEIKQANSSAGYGSYGTYSPTNASQTMSDVRVATDSNGDSLGGSGFAVGDILNITPPASRDWTGIGPLSPPDEYVNNAQGYSVGIAYLNMPVQPTARVTSVNGNGVIQSVVVESGGAFGYGDYAGVGWDDSAAFTVEGDWFGASTSLSTNNTAVDVQTNSSFSGERVHTTPDTTPNTNAQHLDSSAILYGLRTGSDANITANFDTDITHRNSNLLILKSKVLPSGQDQMDYFQITPIDGLGGDGIGIVHREVSSMSDLPLTAPHGHRVKVVGDAELGQDDFYCEFNITNPEAENGDVGQGTWVECAGGVVNDTIDETTMPRQLVNVAPNIFEIRRMAFGSLKAGDEDSNPSPSFIGNKINNMFQFKNRLGFLCRDAVILSESGFGGFNSLLNRQQFNFFRTTVTTLLDSDPIDVTVASDRVTNLMAAKGFQENLVLFSANGQFVLKGGVSLTPKTISVNAITNFNYEDQVEPLPLGSYIYFPFTRGAFTGVREFTTNATGDTYDAVEITEHVPSYIPKDIIDIAGTSAEDVIVLLSGEEKNSLYIYSYFWTNNQKALSAWSKFTFNGEIRGIEFIESTLYMVMTDANSNTHLVTLPFEARINDLDHNGDSEEFLTLLDRRVRAKMTSGSDLIEFEKPDGTYSSANGDLPYTFFTGSIPSGGATLSEVFVDSTGTTHAVKALNTFGTRVHLSNGNASSTLYGYVGIPYTMKYKFSTQVFKLQSGNSKSPSNASELQVRRGTVFFSDTQKFDVKVTPDNRSTASNTFSADDVPEADQLGSIKFAEGKYRFPVFSKAKNADIVIENGSPFDSKFTSAEFESFVHPRSQRYG